MDGLHRGQDGRIWYKQKDTDEIWWLYLPDDRPFKDEFIFSFDMKVQYDFWNDYPDKLTEDQISIFKKEQPELARLKK